MKSKKPIKQTKALELREEHTKKTKLGKVDEHQKKIETFKMKRFEKVES